MVSGPSKSSSSATVMLTVAVPVVCPACMETSKGAAGVKSAASAVPGSAWPTIITEAGVTAVEEREPDREPETTTDSSTSWIASHLTAKSKVADPVEAPAAMAIWKGLGRVVVKSAMDPAVAVPPAAVRVTVVPPAGATTPSGRAAVTVIVCVLSTPPSGSPTRDGLTRRVAAAGSGSATVGCAGSTTVTLSGVVTEKPPLP